MEGIERPRLLILSGANDIPGDRGIEAGRSSAAAPFRVEDLMSFLRGTWTFERKVFDGLTGAEATAGGKVRFTDETVNGAPGLRYREDGELVLGGDTFETEREYLYGFPAHGVAEVRFADGGFFHVLDLSRGIVRVEHRCGDDVYQGLFRALGEQAWLSVWRVAGPRKSHVITTHFIRT